MKLNPWSFRAHVIHMNLAVMRIGVDTNLVENLNPIFSDKFREINAKDKQFCYACRCNFLSTVWEFGYSDLEILTEAAEYINSELSPLAEKIDKILLRNEKDFHQIFEPTQNDGCECPFERKE